MKIATSGAVIELPAGLQADMLDEAVRHLQAQASAIRRGEGHSG